MNSGVKGGFEVWAYPNGIQKSKKYLPHEANRDVPFDEIDHIQPYNKLKSTIIGTPYEYTAIYSTIKSTI